MKKRKPDGQYYRVTFMWQGKRYERKGKTQAEAHEKAAELKAALKRGDIGVSGNMTVKAWANEWLEVYKRPVVGDKQYREYLRHINSYTETSPSGTGIHIYFTASGIVYDKSRYYINKRDIGLEVYVAGMTNKYLTVTGNVIEPVRDLEERGAELMAVLEKYMQKPEQAAQTTLPAVSTALSDDEVIKKASASKTGNKFSTLWHGDYSGYDSQSEADLALCSILAFWCGKNAAQIDRLFQQSGLMRDKWREMHGSMTYGEMTVKNAVDRCREVYNPCSLAKPITVSIPLSPLSTLKPDTNPRYSWSDIGNGNLFADVYKNLARYVPERKQWFVYDGRVWQVDTGGLKAMELCKALADALMAYACSLDDERRRSEYIDFVQRWQRRVHRETIIKDAAGVYPIPFATFDRDPMLLNGLNGTLNLETGEFREHRADDMLSKIAGVNYDPAAHSERWQRFIDEVMEGKTDNAEFLQKALGYALTGDTRHECFFILYGPKSRNGKGTAMETFAAMMNDYAIATRPESIAQKQFGNGSGPNEDIARLIGARFVNISEPDKKLNLNTAQVKTLTGNDTITARYLNENSFQFRPQCKFFINTNHLPTVNDVTLFSSGRVKVVPFNRHFAEHERDNNLKAELSTAENLSGILNWCIDGLKLIRETGFDMPADVIAATDEYKKASDKIGRFIEDELEPNATTEVTTQAVYERYKQWCALNGYHTENTANFKAALETASMTVKRKWPNGCDRTSNAQTLIIGYQLCAGTAAATASSVSTPNQRQKGSKRKSPVDPMMVLADDDEPPTQNEPSDYGF